MTCKDCLCSDVCIETRDQIQMLAYQSRNDVEKVCSNFKDKSRFVELPCKAGDIVYKVSFVHKNVAPLKVEGFLRSLASWKVHLTHIIPSWNGNQKEHLYIAFSSFGKTVFLTPKEAEEKLKETK